MSRNTTTTKHSPEPSTCCTKATTVLCKNWASAYGSLVRLTFIVWDFPWGNFNTTTTKTWNHISLFLNTYKGWLMNLSYLCNDVMNHHLHVRRHFPQLEMISLADDNSQLSCNVLISSRELPHFSNRLVSHTLLWAKGLIASRTLETSTNHCVISAEKQGPNPG